MNKVFEVIVAAALLVMINVRKTTWKDVSLAEEGTIYW